MKNNGRAVAARHSILALVFSLLCCVLCGSAFAQSAVTVVDNGDPQNRVDIVVLGDGYTADEMGIFAADVEEIIRGIFARQPFAEYQRYFNVHRVDVASTESGATHPELGVYRNTAFGAAYNCSGIQRLICANNSKVFAAAAAALPPAKRDMYLLIVNDPHNYGGSGGTIAVVSTYPSVVDLVLHEEGHAFGLLADEYSDSPPPCSASVEPNEPNVTIYTRRDQIKWNHWIDLTTPIPTNWSTPGLVGLFEGAQYCETQKYRPTFNSEMRELGQPFEQVNSEQLVKRIYNWVSPLDSSSPSGNDITVSRGRIQLFSASVPRPLTHDLSVSWFLDSHPAGNDLELAVDTGALAPGTHTVAVVVEDHTNFVRKDPGQVLREVRNWNVTVAEPFGLNLALSAGGAATASTSGGDRAVRTGYAGLDVNSGAIPYGTGIFSLKQDGVTVTEAGVPPSPPTRSARIFIDYRSGVNALPGRSDSGLININTGIVVVNRNSTQATITYKLCEMSGENCSFGNGTVAAGAHVACFIDQLKAKAAPDFVLPDGFQFGSLEVTSSQPVSVLALRGTTNQRNQFLITTTPVADLEKAPSTDQVYFPHFVDGGGYTTSLVLLNTSIRTETGELQVLDENGAPLVVTPAGGTAASTFPYSIAPGAAFRFQTDGSSADIKVGSVRLIPGQYITAPVGSGLFSYNQGAVLVTESGIPSAVPTTHARIFVDLSRNHNTGLAIANVANRPAVITLNAFEKDGITAAGAGPGGITLAPNGQDAAFADQYIAGLPPGFTGVIDIQSNDASFAALTLRSLANEIGDFLITTFPVADMKKPAPLSAPILFPHIADGGGYTTQVLLISPSEASAATLHFYDESGIAIDLSY